MGERLGPDGRLDRAAVPAVVNGNDEYALEAALKLVEAHGGEVTLLSMAPASAPETMRKALAMGATSGMLVTDPALGGSCAVSTATVLAAALKTLEFDLVLAGVDTSDGVAGVVAAGGRGARSACRYLSYAAKIEPDEAAGTVRVRRITPTGYDVLEAPMPALIACTQALGEPRYPSLKGIMAARSKEIATRSLADLGLDAVDGRRRGRDDEGPRHAAAAGPRPRRGSSASAPDEAAAPGRRLPRRAEAHLMARAAGSSASSAPDGGRSRSSRPRSRRWPGRSASRRRLRRRRHRRRRRPGGRGQELAAYLPRVRRDRGRRPPTTPVGRVAARRSPASRGTADLVLSPAPARMAATSPGALVGADRAGRARERHRRSAGPTTDRSSR